ncbi:hypothetical protein SODALDRAFT_359801 [Sodiomyces alkalinus F11]|uniref:Uncharacterized protein n=1 Tax=Sodiomyces alkalinus (strain CBS 110278 / VKM F-3762 / F11) TaxID=1314773 RepID=A0A3N2PW18_SODAK|nr:hypothetical protein SODALDRAFT_359801 [Sodiomyces alkalinus F11]ROT38695.1 hypothetical protein SODALDRAFT_359801 [Sodiomyces alkalinus F11]
MRYPASVSTNSCDFKFEIVNADLGTSPRNLRLSNPVGTCKDTFRQRASISKGEQENPVPIFDERQNRSVTNITSAQRHIYSHRSKTFLTAHLTVGTEHIFNPSCQLALCAQHCIELVLAYTEPSRVSREDMHANTHILDMRIRDRIRQA